MSTFFERQQLADRNQEKWGAYANRYEDSFGRMFVGYASCALELLGKKVAENEKDLTTILDVGCGTGATLDALSGRRFRICAANDENHTISRYFGVDFSKSMIDLCEKKRSSFAASNADTSLSIAFECLDGQNMRSIIQSNSFDAATGLFSVLFFPDRIKGLKEIHRVLRPGGHAVLSGWSSVRGLEWVRFAAKALMRCLAREEWATESRAYDRATRDTRSPQNMPNFLQWSDMSKFDRELETAGFVNTNVVRCTRRFVLGSPDDAERLWRDMAYTFPTVTFLFDEIYAQTNILDQYLDEQARDARRLAFERSVAREFSRLIGERGIPKETGEKERNGLIDVSVEASHSIYERGKVYGYLDGAAVFGIGEKPASRE